MPIIPKSTETTPVTDEVLGTASTVDRVAVDSSKVPLSFEVLGAIPSDIRREQFVHAYHTVATNLHPAFIAIQGAHPEPSLVLNVASHEPPATVTPVVDNEVRLEEEVVAELEAYAEQGVRQVIVQPTASELTGDGLFDPQNLIDTISLARGIKRFSAIGVLLRGGEEDQMSFEGDDKPLRFLEKDFPEVAASADFVITTPLSRPDHYEFFLKDFERAGISTPVIPGIMPFHSLQKAVEYAERHHIQPPYRLDRWVDEAKKHILPPEGSSWDDVISGLTMQHTVELARNLVSLGAPSLHIYTQNNMRLIQRFVDDLQQPQ